MSPADWASRSMECTIPTRPRVDKQRTPEDDERDERLKREQAGDHIPRVLLLRESPYLQGTSLPAWGDNDKPDKSLMDAAKRYVVKYKDVDSCVPISDEMRQASKDQAFDTYGDPLAYMLSEKGILYRLEDNEDPKLVVPQSMRYAVLTHAHEVHVTGHVSSRPMLAKLRQNRGWV